MFNDEQINDILLVLFLLTLSSLGNILYCYRNDIKIKPIYVRILYGFMGVSIYISIYLFLVKRKPELDFTLLALVYSAGYFTQSLVNIVDERLPNIFDRVVNKVLRDIHINKVGENEKEKD